ncbi:MAG: glucose-1-phosphate thymidylyltransferase RfbA, partial [Candidatus Thiodiazotropha sp.]
STLMLAGIKDILIITTPQDAHLFEGLLGNGEQWGLQISYAVQPEPGGLAQAFIIGKDFIGGEPCCLILGDNIYYGHGLVESLKRAAQTTEGATVFGYWVKDPERYGVVDFDDQGQVCGIEEKPEKPKSNYAVTGLYFYDEQVTDLALSLKPSPRGELEITDLNRCYLEQGQLRLEKMGRGIAWLDTGTHESLIQASNFIETIELRQGLKISCPEEIAYAQGWIGVDELKSMAEALSKNGYGQYLLSLCDRRM